jgi:hypothetical protein
MEEKAIERLEAKSPEGAIIERSSLVGVGLIAGQRRCN